MLCLGAGDRWRINFSRVHYNVTWSDQQQRYVKKPAGQPGYNIVWSPQWQVQMHQPETWGYLQFTDAPGGQVGRQTGGRTGGRADRQAGSLSQPVQSILSCRMAVMLFDWGTWQSLGGKLSTNQHSCMVDIPKNLLVAVGRRCVHKTGSYCSFRLELCPGSQCAALGNSVCLPVLLQLHACVPACLIACSDLIHP